MDKVTHALVCIKALKELLEQWKEENGEYAQVYNTTMIARLSDYIDILESDDNE